MNTREWYKVGDKVYITIGTRRGQPVVIQSVMARLSSDSGAVGYNVVALDGAELAYTHMELSPVREWVRIDE